MCTEQYRVITCSYEESILHISCRVLRREVQRFENVLVILVLRSLGHSIAKLFEDIDNLLSGDRYGVTGTHLVRITRFGDIKGCRRGL